MISDLAVGLVLGQNEAAVASEEWAAFSARLEAAITSYQVRDAEWQNIRDQLVGELATAHQHAAHARALLQAFVNILRLLPATTRVSVVELLGTEFAGELGDQFARQGLPAATAAAEAERLVKLLRSAWC